MTAQQVDDFQLMVGDPVVDREIGFLASGFVVDNLTNQWVFLSQPFIFIPPYTVSQAGPMPGTQKLTARFQAPVGFNQLGSIVGQSANIRVTAEPQPSSPGVSISTAPNLIPNQQPTAALWGGALAIGADVTIIPAIPGQQIYLFTVSLFFVPVNPTGVESLMSLHATGLQNPQFAQIETDVAYWSHDFKGIQLGGIGAGLDIHNYSGANPQIIRGVFLFSQA